MARVDYDKQSAVYDEGRGFSPDDYQAWRFALVRFMESGSRVLDLGSGTGRWSTTLADWFGVRIVGVEPSSGMRSRAVAKESNPLISYVAGCAEAIPLGDDAVNAAWLAHVIHHFDDLRAAAHELRRVVPAGAPVLIRQAFSDRLDGISLFRFFPDTVAKTFPSVSDTVGIFNDAGFDQMQLQSHTQQTAPSLEATIERVRLRADTTLELLSHSEFERGLELLVQTARVEHGPVLDTLDLLVLR